jgi:hypothetical protein
MNQQPTTNNNNTTNTNTNTNNNNNNPTTRLPTIPTTTRIIIKTPITT